MTPVTIRSTAAELRRGCPAPGVLATAGLVAVLAAAGCASSPEVTYYDLRFPDPPRAEDAPSLGWLKIAEVEVPSYLDRAEIFYRAGRFEAGWYEYHRWVRPLSESLTAEIADYFRKGGRFDVAAAGEALPSAPVLSVEVLDFWEQSSEEDSWSVHARFLVTVEDPGRALVTRTTLEASGPIAPRNARGTVAALNQAAAQLTEEIRTSVEAFLRKKWEPPAESGAESGE